MDRIITFVIPAFNAEKTIGSCIESILCIQNIDLEIVVVDDGSTDNTLAIIQDYAKNNRKVIILSQENSGPNIARKAGVEKAKGEYVFFCDADDTVDAEGMEEVICEIFDSEYDIYEFGYKKCYPDGKEEISSFNNNIIIGEEVLLHFLRQKSVTNFLWNKCFKRRTIEKIEYVKLFAAEDSCDLLQIFSKADSYCSLRVIAYNYIQTSNSLCRSLMNIRRLDEVKGDEFKIKYLSRIGKNEYTEYLYVQAMAHCAYLYAALSSSSISDKNKYMEDMRMLFDNYSKKIKYRGDAFKVSSLKRKLSIIIFSISPWFYKCIIR